MGKERNYNGSPSAVNGLAEPWRMVRRHSASETYQQLSCLLDERTEFAVGNLRSSFVSTADIRHCRLLTAQAGQARSRI